MIEWVGYAASIMVAISLTMKNVKQLRVLNLIGAVLFTIYGIVIGAWPVVATNVFITGANIYYLAQMARVAVSSEDSDEMASA